MTRNQWLWKGLAVALLLAACGRGAWAQAGLTRIDGYVLDENDKAVVGALVNFTRVDVKSGTVKLKTNKQGYYVDSTIQWGDYDLDVFSADGKTKLEHQSGIHLGSDPVKWNVNLKKAAAVVSSGSGAMSQADAEAIMSGQKKAADEQEKAAAINALLAENKDLRDQGKFADAIPKMEKAVEIDSTHDVLYSNLAEDYIGDKQYDKAIDTYQKAIALETAPAKLANSYVGIGNAYMKKGDQADANTAYDKAKALDPEVGKMAAYNAAVGLFNANKIDEAIQAFSAVIAADPTNANAYYYKGMSLLNKAGSDPATGKLQLVPGTVESLQKYLELAPTGPNAATAKDTLAAIKQ